MIASLGLDVSVKIPLFLCNLRRHHINSHLLCLTLNKGAALAILSRTIVSSYAPANNDTGPSFQRQSNHLRDDYILSVSDIDDRGNKQAVLSMKLAKDIMCNAMVHFEERQEDDLKTSIKRIIDALQLIAANTRCSDSTHRFRRTDAQHINDNVCQ